MSDALFQRPGSVAAPGADENGPRPGTWDGWDTPKRSTSPTGDPGPATILLTPAPDPPPPAGPGRLSVVAATLGGVVAGALMTTSVLSVAGPARPGPVPLTPEMFPREVLGHGREDIVHHDSDAAPVVDRFDRQFQRQLENFRFAHGGEGARLPYTVGAGPGYALTIVNAILVPDVPDEGYAQFYPWGGVVAVTLESEDVVCTIELVRHFELGPEGGFRAVEVTGDVEVYGTTRCVLVDTARNLSLGLEDLAPREAAPADSAAAFSQELRRLHDQVVG